MHINYQLYRLLTLILCPVILGHIVWTAIRNKESRYFWQRLGFKSSHLPRNALWFHCASVGEVNTLIPLLKNLHANTNDLQIIITTNTVTGGKTVSQKNIDYISHAYLPFDWSFCINNFLSRVKPISLYIMETEIWPTLYTVSHNRKLPIYIINARLSVKTTASNLWVKSLLKYSLSKVRGIYARSANEANAYINLGANKAIVSSIGNLKLTTTLPSSQDDIDTNPVQIDREYVLLASTHKDEEYNIYKLWKELARNELLIIAPRHPERSSAIIKQLNCTSVATRTNNDIIDEHTEIYLLDTIGELKDLFSKAKLVIMGGSFTPIGGHNILEPASYNKAIITGPYMDNFTEELALMIRHNAIIQITSTDEPYAELKQELAKLLDDGNYREVLQSNTEKDIA